MARLNLTRRSFTKLAAATAAAAGVIATTEPHALAKLPAVGGKAQGDVRSSAAAAAHAARTNAASTLP